MHSRGKLIAMLVLAAGLISSCQHAHGGSRASLRVTPAAAAIDVPVATTVQGLPAGHPVTLSLTSTDRTGVIWTGSADFRSSAQGTVSTAQAPTGGSYTGADPMGLFQTMAPPSSAPATDDVFKFATPSQSFRLTATVDGTVVASQQLTRTIPEPAHRAFTLAKDGFIASYYGPADTAVRHPAVLAFGGSEGGEGLDGVAALLASHGYPAMSLAYFKEPGLRSSLSDIDLRYFVRALQALAVQPGVDPAELVVYGVSRGSEAAQLLGSLFPKLVHGVVAGVPSSVVNGPYPNQPAPSWLLDGTALPEVPTYLYGEADPAEAPNAVIKDEQIRGPILLACAGQDAVWPSCSYQDAIVARLKAHHFPYPVTALRYPDGGHGIGSASRYNAAIAQAYTSLGGDLLPTQQGRADFYQHLLDYLAGLARG